MRRGGRSVPVAAPVPMAVAHIVAAPAAPVQVPVADAPAMTPMTMAPMMMMPVAVASVHLHERASVGGCCVQYGGLRGHGRGRGWSKQRCSSNKGCHKSRLRQHWSSPFLVNEPGGSDPRRSGHPQPELGCNERFIRRSLARRNFLLAAFMPCQACHALL
jgi:hypothetical protein